jgi:hypothetical protein
MVVSRDQAEQPGNLPIEWLSEDDSLTV